MSQFKYLSDRILNAVIVKVPFPHLELNGFLSEEHLEEILSDPQIHFEEQPSTERLMQTLITKKYKVQDFPGCTLSSGEYLRNFNRNEWPSKHEACESYGITYRLNRIANPVIASLIEYMNSIEFMNSLKQKFNIDGDTTIVSAIQKNLTGYEISPHPDIRQKCMTYLLNINKDDSVDRCKVHTDILKFKSKYEFLYKYWEDNPTIDRFWVPWDWCDVVKTISKNNTMIMFPTSDYTLHAIKLDYDHTKWQRTQIYGNLMFTEPPDTVRQGHYKEFEI